MASTTLTTAIRRRLSTFAAGVARPFSDSRRHQFVTEMITGLVVGGHVHLTKIARATHRTQTNIHAAQKRLSGHLASEQHRTPPLWKTHPGDRAAPHGGAVLGAVVGGDPAAVVAGGVGGGG